MQVLRRWKVDIKNPVSHHIYYCFNLKQLIYAHFNFSIEKKKGGRKGGVKEGEIQNNEQNIWRDVSKYKENKCYKHRMKCLELILAPNVRICDKNFIILYQ